MNLFVLDSDERNVTLELVRRLSSRRSIETQQCDTKDVEFNIQPDMQRNGDINVTLKMQNTSSETRDIDFHLNVLSCRYTGISTSELKDTFSALKLEPQESMCARVAWKQKIVDMRVDN